MSDEGRQTTSAKRIEELEDRVRNMIDRIEYLVEQNNQLEAKLEKAVDLVKGAFNEGFVECMNDVMWQSGGKVKPVRWRESRSCKLLAELKGRDDAVLHGD